MLQAYVLHSFLYQDTSLIVKFFTKEQGVVTLIAKGARRPKSHFFGILQPFVPLWLDWKHKRRDLAVLYNAEARAPACRLVGTYLFGGLYINELLLRLIGLHDPVAELFEFYEKFLINLSLSSKLHKGETADKQLFLEQQLRFLEKKILKAIGYELQLDVESSTSTPVRSEDSYCFDFEQGLKKCLPGSIELSKNIIDGKSLLSLHQDKLDDPLLMRNAKLFMRAIIAHLLGDKPLAIRNLFIQKIKAQANIDNS